MIIGLVGRKGCGKNLAAHYVSAEIPQFREDSFAAPLREVCSVVFGLDPKEMAYRDLKEKPLDRYPFQSPRQIMQLMGTDAVRANWPAAWVEALKRRLKPEDNVIVTDVRFENEAQAIRDLRGKLIRIHRPRPADAPDDDKHASETELEKIAVDKFVLNDGGVDLFVKRVLTAVRELIAL